jgi:putative sigma-54 modulation protein
MKFTFTDKKVNIPDRVHAYAEKKVGKLDRYFKGDAEATIVFSVEKGRNNAEVTIRSGGTIIRVAESTFDMFVTIDSAVASIERQLRKNKARLEKQLRQGAFERVQEPGESYPSAEPEEGEFKVVPPRCSSSGPYGGRGHSPDESGGPYLLRLPQYRPGRRFFPWSTGATTAASVL